MLSQNKEDYLRALYVLHEERSSIHSVDVANYLSISKPSVSTMVRQLDRDGFVEVKPYAPIKFTRRGEEYAKRLTAKHRIIESFLKNVLGMPDKNLHEEAHRLEHAFSEESIRKIRKLLKNPAVDPHGKPIPQ